MSKETHEMKKTVEEKQGSAPGEAEGARRATGASPGAADGSLGPGQRWSRGRKRAVALRLLRGESVDAVSRELGVPIFRLETWREAAFAGIDAAFTHRKEAQVSAELDAALKPRRRAHHGERAVAGEVPRPGPFGPPEVEAMSATTSEATGRRYGVQRVCAAWDVPRSSFYHHRKRTAMPASPPRRRGPKPAISDTALLAAIRADLERSPLTGEGHRKVWGRLRILDGIRVARKRVLRLMREHGLLSPYRHRPAEPNAHEGTLITHAPNVLWGTDGARAFTLDDGWVWIFSAIEHWNGECVGIHVAKKGDRFAALEPLAQGLTRLYGAVTAEVARGLSLRMDHGTQSLADDFQNQLKHWGITPSFAFVEQPQTNGVAERFNRTLKEQVIHGRTYRNVDELRAAVTHFVHNYNHHWRLEKLGFLTPVEARQQYALPEAA